MEENVFSLGNLDETPEGLELEQEETQEENNEQEELYSEDVTEELEESDNEELEEDEDITEEEAEKLDDDSISYTPFVEPLVEEGILWIDEDKEYDDSPEGFQEILQDTISHRVNEVIGSLPEEAQRMIEIAQMGGDIREAFDVFDSFDYSQVDLEDVDTQRELTKDYYKEKFPNWSEDRLTKALQNAEDLDELGELATEAQSYFIEKTEGEKEAYLERVKLAQEERVAQETQEIETYKSLIQESEGFQGLKFNSNRERTEFERYCFQRGEDGLTQYERDSITPEDKMTLAFYRFKKFGFDSIQKTERSKAYVEQKKVLARIKDKNATSNRVGSREVERPSKGFSLGNIG